jgi:hypothetical protein
MKTSKWRFFLWWQKTRLCSGHKLHIRTAFTVTMKWSCMWSSRNGQKKDFYHHTINRHYVLSCHFLKMQIFMSQSFSIRWKKWKSIKNKDFVIMGNSRFMSKWWTRHKMRIWCHVNFCVLVKKMDDTWIPNLLSCKICVFCKIIERCIKSKLAVMEIRDDL